MESDYLSTNPSPSPNVNPPATPVADASASLNPRIDEVEREVKKLKSDVENFGELKNTVEDLKNTIVDIRALMSETQNPFNLLQFITDENDLNKVIKAKPLLEKKLAKDGAVEAKAAEVVGGAGKEVGFAVESQVEDREAVVVEATGNDVEEGEEIVDKVEDENRVEREEVCGVVEESNVNNTSKGTAIIHWIYKMLDLGFNENSIRKICDYCEFFCFMPKGYSEHVSNLVGAVIKARSRKISAEEFILSICCAADATGLRIDPKNLSGLIIKVLGKDWRGVGVKCK
jgi:hypothetical protein